MDIEAMLSEMVRTYLRRDRLQSYAANTYDPNILLFKSHRRTNRSHRAPSDLSQPLIVRSRTTTREIPTHFAAILSSCKPTFNSRKFSSCMNSLGLVFLIVSTSSHRL